MEQKLARAQTMLVRYTKDYLKLKHDSRLRERQHTELAASLRNEASEAKRHIEELREATAVEVQAAATSAQTSSENYVSLYRRQVATLMRPGWGGELREGREGREERGREG